MSEPTNVLEVNGQPSLSRGFVGTIVLNDWLGDLELGGYQSLVYLGYRDDDIPPDTPANLAGTYATLPLYQGNSDVTVIASGGVPNYGKYVLHVKLSAGSFQDMTRESRFWVGVTTQPGDNQEFLRRSGPYVVRP